MLSVTCTSHRRLFPCSQQKGLEGWGGEGWSPHSLNTKRCACLHSCHSLSHPCLVRSLHPLIPCKLPLLTRAACLPSGHSMFSPLCQIPYTKLYSWYADGYQLLNPIHTTGVNYKKLNFYKYNKAFIYSKKPNISPTLPEIKIGMS